MNVRVNDEELAQMKFAVGQPVVRNEDLKLLKGQGSYTDDVNLPGQAYLAMVRSTHAHGVIKRIDASAAKAMPGVIDVLTGEAAAIVARGDRCTMVTGLDWTNGPVKTVRAPEPGGRRRLRDMAKCKVGGGCAMDSAAARRWQGI